MADSSPVDVQHN
ncbi:unnamed protein product, partial [Rotaria sp. Silwood1]